MGKRTLDERTKLEIAKMIALGYGSALIAQELDEKFNVKTSVQNIYNGYLRNESFMKRVSQIRATMDIEVNKHPIASKIARLDYILKGINECLTWRLHKTTKNDEGKVIQRELRRPFHTLPALIREARAEVEGDPELAKRLSLYDLIKEFEPPKNKGAKDKGENENGNGHKRHSKRIVQLGDEAGSPHVDLENSRGPRVL